MNSERPNVLLLFSDQHSARALGCYGNPEVRTPRLDSLAAAGVRFTNAFAQSPICTPSRMCFMSGQYPHNTGYYGLMGPRPARLPSAFSHFRRHGYRTGMAGKIHTPSGWLSADCDFVRDGYGYETRLTPWNAFLQEGMQGLDGDHYALYLRDRGLSGLREDKINPDWRSKDPAFQVEDQGLDARPSALSLEDQFETWTARATMRFIEEAAHDRVPFFFWMTVPRPHETYIAAREFWDLYDGASLTLPPNAADRLEGRHPAARRMQRYFQDADEWRLYDPRDWESVRRRILHGYYACVTQVDHAVGLVLDKLEELDLRRSTIVIYASDHGEFAAEHGMIEKAPGIAFRCVTRIPMIWSWPGRLPAGAVRSSLVESVDFLPTASALAGIPAPDWVDGCDVTGSLVDGQEVKQIAVTENPWSKTIHTARYKLTQYLPEMCGGEDFAELYDVEADPWEMKNLYLDPSHRHVAAQLLRELYFWLVRTSKSITMNPVVQVEEGGKPQSWDVAGSLYAEDGRVGYALARRLAAAGNVNYL